MSKITITDFKPALNKRKREWDRHGLGIARNREIEAKREEELFYEWIKHKSIWKGIEGGHIITYLPYQ